MVVYEYQNAAAAQQRIAHHLTRVDRCLAHRAPEHLDVVHHPVLRVEVNNRKHFMWQVAQPSA